MLGVLAFVAMMFLGVLARVWGGVAVVSPADLYARWLHYSEWEFKKNAVYWAGKHFEKNWTVVNLKGWAATGMSALFLAETVFLLMWAVEEV